MKKFIAILMVALMALLLVACGSGKPASDPAAGIVGTWELDDAESEESKQVVELMKAFGMSMTFEFKADGTGTLTTVMGEEPEVNEFSYEIKDDQIVIDGSGATFKIEGDNLHIDVEGEMLIFKKK